MKPTSQDRGPLGDKCKEISLGSIFLFLRLRLLWEEEVSRHGMEKASMLRVMLRFQRTRSAFEMLPACCFSVMGVLGPVSGRCGPLRGTLGVRGFGD